MGFEKHVLQTVEPIAGSDSAAFYNGTLFVSDCTALQAARIETALIEHFRAGVIVSPQGTGEFSFDFV